MSDELKRRCRNLVESLLNEADELTAIFITSRKTARNTKNEKR